MGKELDKLKANFQSEREASDYSGFQHLTVKERKDLADFVHAVNRSNDYETAQGKLSKTYENKAWSNAGSKRKGYAKKAKKLYNKMKENPKYKDILKNKYHGRDDRAQRNYAIDVGDAKLNVTNDISYEKIYKNVAKTKAEQAVDRFIDKESKRLSIQNIAERNLSKKQAFSKLSDVAAIRQRQAELGKTASTGLSLQQKAAEKAKVSAAIRGQQRSIGRRMQSVLSGQGIRGTSPSAVMKNINQKAKKQMAQFEMGQMARSYSEKQKAADKKAAMDMDIAQFDIGQDKAGLEFMEARRRKPLEKRQQIVNALQAQGKKDFESLTTNLETAEEYS